jgi:predicted CoA-binding protein
MAVDGLDDAAVRRILTTVRSVAMVGASDNPQRPSFGVLRFLLARGLAVVPVNPGLTGQVVQGQAVVGTLAEAMPVDMVDVFRASDKVGPVVDEAIRLGVGVVWLQLGVVDEAAAERGRAAGMVVVMDRCPAIEWGRLGLGA